MEKKNLRKRTVQGNNVTPPHVRWSDFRKIMRIQVEGGRRTLAASHEEIARIRWKRTIKKPKVSGDQTWRTTKRKRLRGVEKERGKGYLHLGLAGKKVILKGKANKERS